MTESLDLYIEEFDELAEKIQANLVRAVENYCTLYQAMQDIKPSVKKEKPNYDKEIIKKLQNASYSDNLFNKKILKKKGLKKWDYLALLAE